jgi:hypothetical protein
MRVKDADMICPLCKAPMEQGELELQAWGIGLAPQARLYFDRDLILKDKYFPVASFFRKEQRPRLTVVRRVISSVFSTTTIAVDQLDPGVVKATQQWNLHDNDKHGLSLCGYSSPHRCSRQSLPSCVPADKIQWSSRTLKIGSNNLRLTCRTSQGLRKAH